MKTFTDVLNAIYSFSVPLLGIVGAIIAFYFTVKPHKPKEPTGVLPGVPSTALTDWEGLSKSRGELLDDERDKTTRLEAKIMALEIRNDELERRNGYLWNELEGARKNARTV